jgi:ribosomal protein S6
LRIQSKRKNKASTSFGITAQEPKILAEVDKALRYEEDILRYITHVADEELEKHLNEVEAKKAEKAEKPEVAGEDSRNNRESV